MNKKEENKNNVTPLDPSLWNGENKNTMFTSEDLNQIKGYYNNLLLAKDYRIQSLEMDLAHSFNEINILRQMLHERFSIDSTNNSLIAQNREANNIIKNNTEFWVSKILEIRKTIQQDVILTNNKIIDKEIKIKETEFNLEMEKITAITEMLFLLFENKNDKEYKKLKARYDKIRGEEDEN